MANDKIFKDQKQEVFRVALRKILFILWWGDHEVTSMNKVFVPFPIDVVESEEDDRTNSIPNYLFGLNSIIRLRAKRTTSSTCSSMVI